MRYTTLIDITEFPEIYRNVNLRLIYLHLSLKAGYHDNDRDIIRTSFRRIASDVGISVSAVRHAIDQLEHYGLLRRQGDTWIVKKWIADQPITPREKKTRQKAEETRIEERQAAARKLDKQLAEERERREKYAREPEPRSAEQYFEWRQTIERGGASAVKIAACKAFESQYKDWLEAREFKPICL